MTLSDAAATTATGDVWLFRGPSPADRAIRLFTNSPVNHVSMVVALDDLPPLLWHAELEHCLAHLERDGAVSLQATESRRKAGALC